MRQFKSSLFSRLFGSFASCKFPKPVQWFINFAYTKILGVDLYDFDNFASYPSLNALFTRKLKKGRFFSQNENVMISPCDSFISASGKIEDAQALQIKGFSYGVSELLGYSIVKSEKNRLENGQFINFYLSPKDYHRYHVPIDMYVAKAVHIPGRLYPVNFRWLQKIPQLFCENERVVLECYTKKGKLFYLIFVGALNVGKMVFNFDACIQTNAKKQGEKFYTYDELYLQKGDELGRFEMGSTIVMLFEQDTLALTCKSGASVRFGDAIATLS
ncbi:MAG: phosphatidylserine decarboxylase [Sulfurospirillum sp.]|nr:phosphatidylserine decarboxylase [Sulfurospirillum sp.]